jgi:hypothetical protein
MQADSVSKLLAFPLHLDVKQFFKKLKVFPEKTSIKKTYPPYKNN